MPPRPAACAPAPPRQALGASGQVVILVSPELPAPLGEYSIENTAGRKLRARPGLSQSLSPSAQVLWTCRDGFRRRQRETSWNWSLAPSPPAPQALSRPGCSCIKLLISSCPRLGAEHALGICHKAAGNFATVSTRVEQEEGASPAVLCPFPKG